MQQLSVIHKKMKNDSSFAIDYATYLISVNEVSKACQVVSQLKLNEVGIVQRLELDYIKTALKL